MKINKISYPDKEFEISRIKFGVFTHFNLYPSYIKNLLKNGLKHSRER